MCFQAKKLLVLCLLHAKNVMREMNVAVSKQSQQLFSLTCASELLNRKAISELPFASVLKISLHARPFI